MQRTPPELTAHARALRTQATEAERRLWRCLRSHRPRFTRQLVVDRYIVDLACRSLRIAIELDGGQHAARGAQDRERTAYLEAQGWLVLRFWNNEVMDHPDGVVGRILSACAARVSTHPQPLPGREGRP